MKKVEAEIKVKFPKRPTLAAPSALTSTST